MRYIPDILYREFQRKQQIFDDMGIPYPMHMDTDAEVGFIYEVDYEYPEIYQKYAMSVYEPDIDRSYTRLTGGNVLWTDRKVIGTGVTSPFISGESSGGTGTGGTGGGEKEYGTGDTPMLDPSPFSPSKGYGDYYRQMVVELNDAESMSEQMEIVTRYLGQSMQRQQHFHSAEYGERAPSLLMLNEEDVIRTRIKAEIEKWKKDNPRWQILARMPGIGPQELSKRLHNHLMDIGLQAELADELGVTVDEIDYNVGSMLASGASAIMMLLSKGNFPLGAAAYFGVKAALGQSRDYPDLYAGTEGTGAEIDGYPVEPMGVEIPEGLPNEIFEEYRFICYDRLSGRWYPSDEIRPLAYEGNESYRWFCLDRVSGKIYKANLIKKPRIYLQ